MPSLRAVLAGLVAGLVDVLLIVSFDSSASGWVIAQAFLFWVVAGWLVVSVPTRLPWVAHGVVLTVLLNLPWYVAFGPAIGQWAQVPPLVAMSVLFGVGFGWVRRGARA